MSHEGKGRVISVVTRDRARKPFSYMYIASGPTGAINQGQPPLSSEHSTGAQCVR